MKILLEIIPYSLRFRYPFRLAHGTRSSTPSLFVKLTVENFTGYGEATLPPYLTDTPVSATAFLKKINTDKLLTDDAEELHDYLNSITPACKPAQAAIDMAWHDIKGKRKGLSVYQLYGLSCDFSAPGMFTIGISSEDELAEKIAGSRNLPLLKIKTGGGNDRTLVEQIRKITGKPLCIDANQSWSQDHRTPDLLHWLNNQNVILVEQPFGRNEKETEKVIENSPIPVIADESFQTLDDLEKTASGFHGINVKLMKCGGIYPAYQIIREAKTKGLKVLIGCMSESSCGCAAASHLLSLADWYDLDGPLLISNDPFTGLSFQDGKIAIPTKAGLGINAEAF